MHWLNTALPGLLWQQNQVAISVCTQIHILLMLCNKIYRLHLCAM